MRHMDSICAVFALFACAVCIGCSTVESTKYIIYETGSINLHPVPYALSEVEGQAGSPGEMILPDGTYFAISGGGSANNLTLLTMQNDGTSQTSRGQVDAEVSPTVTGQGNASTTKGDEGPMAGDAISEEGEGAVEDTN